MVGQDGIRADVDVTCLLQRDCGGEVMMLSFICSYRNKNEIVDDRTSIFPTSCCRGCGARDMGVATEGRAEAWVCSGR